MYPSVVTESCDGESWPGLLERKKVVLELARNGNWMRAEHLEPEREKEERGRKKKRKEREKKKRKEKKEDSRPHGNPLSPGLIDGQNEGAFQTQASAPLTDALIGIDSCWIRNITSQITNSKYQHIYYVCTFT